MKIIFLFILSSVPLIAALVYIKRRRMFLLPLAKTINDGYKKIRFVTFKKKNYVYGWDKKKCLYYQIRIESAKASTYTQTNYKEANEFEARFGSSAFVIPSNKIVFNIENSLKKYIAIPLNESINLVRSKDKLALYKKYFLNGEEVKKRSQATLIFSDFSILENHTYYLIAFFRDGLIDLSQKVYIFDSDRRIQNEVYRISFLIAAPGLVLMLLTFYLLWRTA